MAVCLKILCFAIWMTIMMVLIHGSKQRKYTSIQQVCLQLSEDDEIEKSGKCRSEIKLGDKLSKKNAAPSYQQNIPSAAFKRGIYL